MTPTLLLNDEPETVRLMLTAVRSGGVAVRESEARAGCNCDRWGHPCPVCDEREAQMKAQVAISSPSKELSRCGSG